MLLLWLRSYKTTAEAGACPADLELLESFLNEDACCLGPWFSEGLQSLGREYLSSGR